MSLKSKSFARMICISAIGVSSGFIAISSSSAEEPNSDAIKALDFYAEGKWMAGDEIQTPAGDSFHVVFDLEWFDQDQTIARMSLARYTKTDDAPNMIEGYYFLNPIDNTMTYQSHTFDGRYNSGKINVEENGGMVVDFTSFDLAGRESTMKIKRTVVNADQFDERVEILLKGQWNTLAEGHWSRIVE